MTSKIARLYSHSVFERPKLVIVMLLFGTKRLRNVGSDLGGALSGFRKAVRDTEETRDALALDAAEQTSVRAESTSRQA